MVTHARTLWSLRCDPRFLHDLPTGFLVEAEEEEGFLLEECLYNASSPYINTDSLS